MSAVIGRFVLETRWSIPDNLRHTTKWRKGLHAAATTGRNYEPQRLSMLLDWLWTAALPLCQPVAGRWGCGWHWREMVSRRTVETCREAARAPDEAGGRDSRAASQAALAAHSISGALNELAIRPHSHELAASHIADAASRAVTASTYDRPRGCRQRSGWHGRRASATDAMLKLAGDDTITGAPRSGARRAGEACAFKGGRGRQGSRRACK